MLSPALKLGLRFCSSLTYGFIALPIGTTVDRSRGAHILRDVDTIPGDIMSGNSTQEELGVALGKLDNVCIYTDCQGGYFIRSLHCDRGYKLTADGPDYF